MMAAPETATAPAAPIDDAAWAAMRDKPVVLERRDGEPVRGKLIAHEGTHAVVQQQDGKVVSIAKADVASLASDEPKAATPAPADATPPAKQPAKPTWKYHKLGLFTLHGIGYTRWRTPTLRDGGASYNLDAAVGFNFSERFGVYALVGGAVGANLASKTVKGHYGHFALSFLARRKYIAFIPGIGLAVAGRRGPGDGALRETGLAVPLKLMGLIPLPKELTLTVGIGYDLAILAQTRPLQSVSFQIGVARF